MKVFIALLALAVLVGGGYLLLQRSHAEPTSGLAMDAEPEAAKIQESSPEADLLGQVEERAVRTQDTGISSPTENSFAEATGKGPATFPRTLVGKVLDEQGQPIEGVEVRAWAKTKDAFFLMDRSEQLKEPSVLTNAEGEFRLETREERALQLALERSEYVPLRRTIPASVDRTVDVGSITLAWAMVLEGRIVDERGAGIPGVSLRLPSANDSSIIVLVDQGKNAGYQTNADGSFRLDQLAPGPWRFWLHSSDHRDRIVAGEMPSTMRQSGLLWTLEDGMTVRGRVLGVPRDFEGKLAVRCSWKDESELQRWMGGSTAGFMIGPDSLELDRGLDFELRGLHSGAEYSVGVVETEKAKNPWINANEYLTQVETVTAGEGEVTLQWVLRASLRIRVVDSETKEPLEKVRLAPKDWEYFSVFAEEQAKAEGPGTWLFEGIPVGEGKLDLTLSAKGYADRVFASINLQKGQCTDLGTVELVRGDTIQVRVTEEKTGAPVEGAELVLKSEVSGHDLTESLEIDSDGNIQSGKRFTARTDEKGVASIQFVPGASMNLSIKHERYATKKVAAQVFDAYREAPFEVGVSGGGTILCTLVDADGVPVSGQIVQCSPEVEPSPDGSPTIISASFGEAFSDTLAETTNAQGIARFRQLAPGDYRCKTKSTGMVEGDGFMIDFGASFERGGPEENTPSSQRVTVLEGEVTELQLIAPKLGTIEGSIREDGQPLVGAKISVADEDAPGGMPAELLMISGGGKQARTDAKGAFRLENVKPGKKILTITHDMRVMPAKYPIEVLEGNNPFSVNLSVTIVGGRAVDKDGKGVAGVTVDAIEETKSTERRVQMSFSMMGEGGAMIIGSSGMGGNRPPVVTDEQGFYRLRGVLAGKPIRITGKGDGYQECKTEPMVLPEAAVREGVELRMLLASKIVITVQHANRDPWKGTIIRLEAIEDGEGNPIPPDSAPPGIEFTNEKGIATFDGLAPGKYRATFAREIQEGQNRNQNHEARPEPIEVQVRSGAITEATMKP